MIFANSHLQSFHAAYNREHENKLSVSQQVVFCLLLYMGVLRWDPIPKLCFVMVLISCKDFLQIVRIFCHDLTDRSCPRLTPLSWELGRLPIGSAGRMKLSMFTSVIHFSPIHTS